MIEIVISITLLGMTIVATLSLLAATINGTSIDRDHANAHAWLQTASDILYASPLSYCSELEPILGYPPSEAELDAHVATLIASYETTVKDTENPEGWPDPNIKVVGLELWHYQRDPVTNGVDEGWDNWCDESSNLQKIKLQVKALDGRIVEDVEVIIGRD